MTPARSPIAVALCFAACLALGCGGAKHPSTETAEAEAGNDENNGNEVIDDDEYGTLRMAPRPDTAQAAEGDAFKAARAYLKEASGKTPKPVQNLPGGYYVEFKKKEGVAFFEKHRRPLLDKGAYLFMLHNGYGMGADSYALLPLTDQLEVVAALGTNGANYDMGSQDVIDYLKKLHAEQPFTITGANGDFVTGTFNQPVKDAERLAKEMYAFCPDIVDQGTETVEKLAEELRATNTFFFWWD